MILSLIGYRGTGKSTLAPLLARELGWIAVDADRELEHREGCTIAEMFARHGEPWFREREAALLEDLFQQEDLVIATGGGAVLNPQTRQRMRDRGPVLWLQAEPETILQRILGDVSTQSSRPALTGLPAREEILKLLEIREPIYRQTSHLQIKTTGRSLEEIMEEIRRQLRTLPDHLQPLRTRHS